MAQLLLTATMPKEGLRKVLRAGFHIPLDEAEVVDRPVTRANMALLNISTSRTFLCLFCRSVFFLLLGDQLGLLHLLCC